MLKPAIKSPRILKIRRCGLGWFWRVRMLFTDKIRTILRLASSHRYRDIVIFRSEQGRVLTRYVFPQFFNAFVRQSCILRDF